MRQQLQLEQQTEAAAQPQLQAPAAAAANTQDEFIRVSRSYEFLMRNKALYDVLLSQASAGSLAGKVNVVD